MPEEWFVRVQGTEYGPVDFDELVEWKAEGRLIPKNPVRKNGETAWSTAAEIPGLFEPIEPPAPDPSEPIRRRTFSEILSETVWIYRRGFWQFFLLALLVALPSLALKLSLAFVNYKEGEPISRTTQIASAIAMVMLALVIVAWPIFVGGLQFATNELSAGRGIRLGEILRRAINFWPRLARLCLFVYGSYFFWTILPLLGVVTFAGNPNVLTLIIALLALAVQVYMVGRLFINFMFWQQAATIGGLESVEALQESRDLARSRKTEPLLQRPLWRGAILASLWLVILVAFSIAIELPFMIVRLNGITNFDQAYALAQNMVNAPRPDSMTIALYVLSSLAHAALRPLLGIAFVVLYFDAKATR